MKKILYTAVLPLFFISCSYSGGLWQEARSSIDSTGPVLDIAACTPADGSTGRGYSQVVTLTFDQEVDPASISADTVKVMQDGAAVAGTLTVDGDEVTFTPSVFYKRGAAYPVTVQTAKGVTDIYGNPSAEEETLTFSILENPSVTAITPAVGTIDPVNVITVTFSEPIKVAGAVLSASITSTPSYAGTVTPNAAWDGTGILTINLSEYLTFGTAATLTLNGFTGLDGAPLAVNSCVYTVNAAWQDLGSVSIADAVDAGPASDLDRRTYHLMAADTLYLAYISSGTMYVYSYDPATNSWSPFGQSIAGVSSTYGISGYAAVEGTVPTVWLAYTDSMLNKLYRVSITAADTPSPQLVSVLGDSMPNILKQDSSAGKYYLGYTYPSNGTFVSSDAGASATAMQIGSDTANYSFDINTDASVPYVVRLEGSTMMRYNWKSDFTGWDAGISGSAGSSAQILRTGTTGSVDIVAVSKTSGFLFAIDTYNMTSTAINNPVFVATSCSSKTFDLSCSSRGGFIAYASSANINVVSASITGSVIDAWDPYAYLGQDCSVITASSNDGTVVMMDVPSLNRIAVVYRNESTGRLHIAGHSY